MLTSLMGSNSNRTLKSKNTAGISRLLNYQSEAELDRARLVEALAELHNLLEEYAPTWYTQEHHEKAMSALQARRR